LTALLSIFCLKPKTVSKNTVWNRWCFWRHKQPCNQSDEWRRGSFAYS